MSPFQSVHPVTETRDDQREVPQQPRRANADVLRPCELRARLGLGRTWFTELQQRGRFRHLLSANVSAALGTPVYSRRKVEAWIEESPALGLRKRG